MADRRRPGDPEPPPIDPPILDQGFIFGRSRGVFRMPSHRQPSPFIPRLDGTGQLLPNRANEIGDNPAKNQMMFMAQDEVIPILYGGPELLSGLLYFYGIYQGLYYMACMILCEGEIELIGSSGTGDADTVLSGFLNGDVAAVAGPISVWKYRGTNTQNVNAQLQALNSAFDENLRGTAYYVVQASYDPATGVPRITVPVKGRKLYDPRCNLITYSNDFTSGNWGQSFIDAITTSSQNAVGPYGATNYAWTVNDNSASLGVLYQNITGLTDNSASYVGSIKVAKRAGAPQFGFDLSISGGAPPVVVNARIMPETGVTTGSSAGVTATDLGTTWLLSIPITNNSSGNTTLQMAIYPAAANAAATGYNVISEAQVRHGVRPSGYIETTAALDQPTQFSNNTALVLGDYISSPVYGENRAVNQQWLATAAEFCDQRLGIVRTGTYAWATGVVTVTTTDPHGLSAGQWYTNFDFTSGAATPDGQYAIVAIPTPYTFTFNLAGSGAGGSVSFWNAAQNEKRSTITIVISEIRPKKEWRDLIRSYIPAWVNDGGDEAFIRVDGPSSVDHTFGDADIDVTDSIPSFERSGVSQSPNVVTITYTDTSKYPWKTAAATSPDVIPSNARRTGIDMPGMRSYAQAKRYAIEKLNHYSLEDLSGDIDVFDIGLKVTPGDIATITYTPLNISAKQFRVLGVEDRGHGRWRLRLREYQPNVYSNSVQSTPAYPDVPPPNPSVIPALGAVILTSDRALVSGVWQSCIRATWPAETSWPYVQSYHVELFEPPSTSLAYSITGNIVTVTWNGHGMVSGMPIYVDFTSSSGAIPTDGFYDITSAATNTFTFALTHANVSGNATVRKLREQGEPLLPTWLSGPVVLAVEYLVRVRIRSIWTLLGP